MSRAVSVNNQYPHVGMAAYFERPVGESRERAEQVSRLLVDERWPWIPWYAQFVGIHKRDDTRLVKVGGKNGYTPLLEGIRSLRFQKLRMNRARGDKDYASVQLPFDPDRLRWGYEAPYQMLITCRSAELPEGKTFAAWITLAHELVAAVGALNATIGAWPTYDHAIRDTWLTRIVLDQPTGDTALNELPEELDAQIDLLQRWDKKLGRTYARHPRWGTYLNAAHVAAIGGADRIRSEVQPARIEAVGELTYIQLTESIATGMSPEAGERRRRLQTVMDPILLGAGHVAS